MNYIAIINLSEQPNNGDGFRLILNIPLVIDYNEYVTFVNTVTDADTQVLIGADVEDTQTNLIAYLEYLKDTLEPDLTTATVTSGVDDYDVKFEYGQTTWRYQMHYNSVPDELTEFDFEILINASSYMEIDKITETFEPETYPDSTGDLTHTLRGSDVFDTVYNLFFNIGYFNEDPRITYTRDTDNVYADVIGSGSDVFGINEILNDTDAVVITNYSIGDDEETTIYIPVDDNSVKYLKTLTSYYLETPFVNPLTDVVSTSYTVKIYIWNGNFTAVPSLPEYEKTKINSANSSAIDKVNISRIINDFIDFTINADFDFAYINGNNQYWVKTEIFYNDQPETAQFSQRYLAIKGYGYFLEGDKPQPPANKVLLLGDEYKVSRSGMINVPILLDKDSDLGDVTVKSYPLNEIDETINTNPTSVSSELIKNVWVAVSEAPNDEYIEVAFNGVTKTFLITDECRYTPLDIAFRNKNGAIQVITFFKVKKDSITVDSEKYEANISDYNKHQFVKYNINSKSKFTVNSGFVDEDRNADFKQLLLSGHIWLLQNETTIPINISTSSLEYKTRQNDRLINYQIEFEYSFNDINNI